MTSRSKGSLMNEPEWQPIRLVRQYMFTQYINEHGVAVHSTFKDRWVLDWDASEESKKVNTIISLKDLRAMTKREGEG